MFLGTVNRMILAELVKVFLLSLLALTGMFLLAGLIQEASQKGLSPGQIIMAIIPPHTTTIITTINTIRAVEISIIALSSSLTGCLRDYSGLRARKRSTIPHFERSTSAISKPTPGR